MRSFNTFFALFIGFLLLLAACSPKKYGSSKNSRLYYAYKYKGRLLTAKQQCDRALRKKYKKPKKPLFYAAASNTSSTNTMAEYDPNDTPPPPPPKPKPQPTAKVEQKKPVDHLHGRNFDELSLDEKHKIEDEVLKENNIPAPTSEEHEKIRNEVVERLKKGTPIQLEPLYFTHAEDEFAVVDMEPFLVAVEYALQGRMILIEGHTDNTGNDNYNLQLSIKRVEKIRQLMHDMGVPDDRISVVGYGEEIATHDNTTEEGRQKNRRVDFKVF